MYMSLIGRMLCNEFKRSHNGFLCFRNLLNKYPVLAFIVVVFGVPLASLAMVFALTMIVMYPVSVLAGWA